MALQISINRTSVSIEDEKTPAEVASEVELPHERGELAVFYAGKRDE